MLLVGCLFCRVGFLGDCWLWFDWLCLIFWGCSSVGLSLVHVLFSGVCGWAVSGLG